MRMVFGLVLLVGIGLAGFAVYMAQGYISQYQTALAQERAAREKQVKLTDVYVAARPLKYGEQLTLEDAKLIKWPEEFLPEGAFTTEDALLPGENAEFRTVLRAMEANEPLLAVKLTEPGQDAGITSRLSRGMRAFAINVDVSSGVSGFLRPGDRVDVYWTGSTGQARETRKVTKLIEANVRLIAVDQTADEDRYSPVIARTVTVEASPQQVAALAQAQSTGKLSLSLVGAQDDTTAESVEINQRQLLGIPEEEQVVEKKAEKQVCTIRTRKGSDVIEIPIPCTN
ncbi:MAG: Flp pilus assembly protein CpaB [Pseudomonadota bacterium]|jgi:pilus assembly protein CpaB|uniref:Flp pilus assembly protein CpaB n=1 Tax=Rhodovulum sp. FJ3 TaxID=3079053 RepID=UPI000C0B4A4F|nr:Flp pilus assembly protein CpaB [Rhodovulum sp. FJ3]MAY31984.1 Flp pilus assembly protein CpaB [Rhodovulum sp.]MDV4167164.1 Flp pilus assembly protein CpaB [Rhodovulum sp. FJ3]MEC8630118.1 Flp pilus assembly protein CpaB [Pseudomonadota bacterium]MEE3316707.1 Flp pilus assembly protein CpaB [Pseudomonadota bacterium]